MKSKPSAKGVKQYTISPRAQRYFLIFIIGPFLLQNGYMMYQIIDQYIRFDGGAPLLSVLITTLLVPFLYLAVAYYLNPKKLRKLTRTFESMLFVITAMSIHLLLTQVYYQFVWRFLTSPTSQNSFLVQEIIMDSVALALFTGILYYLRRSKRWA